MIAPVPDLIGSVSKDPVHLVGLSFGGMIPQATVLAHPELVRSLTLMGTAPSFSKSASEQCSVGRDDAAGWDGCGAAGDTGRWFTRKARETRPDLIDRVTKTILADRSEIHAAIWEQIATFNVQDRLDEIRCPTLVLVGEEDPSTPTFGCFTLRRRFQGTRIVVFPEASHMVHLEAADAVTLELQQFFREN